MELYIGVITAVTRFFKVRNDMSLQFGTLPVYRNIQSRVDISMSNAMIPSVCGSGLNFHRALYNHFQDFPIEGWDDHTPYSDF